MVEQYVFELLRDDAALNAIVGGKIQAVVARENVRPPYVVYLIEGKQQISTLCGPINAWTGTLVVHCLDSDYTRVKDLEAAALSALSPLCDASDAEIEDKYEPTLNLYHTILALPFVYTS